MGNDFSGMLKLGMRSPYRPEIDGLRALAVVAVIVNHINPAILPSGYLGVDVFFVISGYVITSSLLTRKAQDLGQLLIEFYSRRIRRLLPALIVCVVITAGLVSLFNPDPGATLNTGMSALIGGANLNLLYQSTNYFASSTKLNVFTHTWSLGVEEQFYLFYPILLWYALKPTASRRLIKVSLGFIVTAVIWLLLSKAITGSALGLVPGGIETLLLLAPYLGIVCAISLAGCLKPAWSARTSSVCMISVLAILSLCFFWFSYDRNLPIAYFLMPARFWELAAGCLLFLGCWNCQQQKPIKGLSLFALTLLVVSLFIPLSSGKVATVLVVGLTTLLIGSLDPSSLVYTLLTYPLVVKVGLISYSLYLWHWSVLSLSRWTIGVSAITVVPQLALMFLLGWASYHYVEEPFRRSDQQQTPHQIILYGLSALAIAMMSVMSIKAKAEYLSLDRHFPGEFARQPQAQFITDPIANTIHPEKLHKTLTADRNGNPLPRPRVYLIGDSHADHYKEALAAELPDKGLGNAITGWRCGYISPRDIEPLTRQWMNRCEDYKTFIDDFIKTEVTKGDIFVLVHRWSEKKKDVYLAETLNQLAVQLAKKGAFLILIDDVPELDVENPLLCEKRPWRPLPPVNGCFQSVSTLDESMKKLDKIGHELTHSHPNVSYLKLRHLYCDDTLCGPYVKSVLIYKDNNHLNSYGSRLGAKKIADFIHRFPLGHQNIQG